MLFSDPTGALNELKGQFSQNGMKQLLRLQIETTLVTLEQRVQSFSQQLSDFVRIAVQDRQGQFTVFRRLLNFDAASIAGRPQSCQFLDYQVVNSDIDAERDHLRIGGRFVRILTMKESIIETRPLVLDALLKIPCSFTVCTEWVPLSQEKARKEVTKRRRHFNISKTGFVSQLGNDTSKMNPRDVLVDESKQADIENLGTAYEFSGRASRLATSPSRSFFMANPYRNSINSPANSVVSLPRQMGIFTPKHTTNSRPILRRCPAIML